MLESPATRYSLFAFDAEDKEWTEYKIDMPAPDLLSPVEVNFEFIATDGEYLEGIGDWNGWDSFFTGGAHVRSVVSQSIPNSIDIRDNTDFTRIFEGGGTLGLGYLKHGSTSHQTLPAGAPGTLPGATSISSTHIRQSKRTTLKTGRFRFSSIQTTGCVKSSMATTSIPSISPTKRIGG